VGSVRYVDDSFVGAVLYVNDCAAGVARHALAVVEYVVLHRDDSVGVAVRHMHERAAPASVGTPKVEIHPEDLSAHAHDHTEAPPVLVAAYPVPFRDHIGGPPVPEAVYSVPLRAVSIVRMDLQFGLESALWQTPEHASLPGVADTVADHILHARSAVVQVTAMSISGSRNASWSAPTPRGRRLPVSSPSTSLPMVARQSSGH
jgi:hypothetical protein